MVQLETAMKRESAELTVDDLNHISSLLLEVTFHFFFVLTVFLFGLGSCHKRQKPQAPTPQAPNRNCHTRIVANAKVRNR